MFGNQHIKMDLDVQKEGFLWLSGRDFSNWKAFFNGRPVRLYDGKAQMKSVYLPAGKGELLLTYRYTSSARLVLFISLILGVVLAYFAALYFNLVRILTCL